MLSMKSTRRRSSLIDPRRLRLEVMSVPPPCVGLRPPPTRKPPVGMVTIFPGQVEGLPASDGRTRRRGRRGREQTWKVKSIGTMMWRYSRRRQNSRHPASGSRVAPTSSPPTSPLSAGVLRPPYGHGRRGKGATFPAVFWGRAAGAVGKISRAVVLRDGGTNVGPGG